MDAAFFLHRRTRFIRYYYAVGVGPFREIQRKINAQENPYNEAQRPNASEIMEPTFMEEWIEADEASQIVGLSAVSLLSDTLKLYFRALEQQLGFRLSPESKRKAKKEGFLTAYRDALSEMLETDWSSCPVRFEVIEQIVLARNRAQHGDHLSILSARHDPKTLAKHRELIFASESELKMWVDEGANPDTWFAPRLEIIADNLNAAVGEVEKLASWIDERIQGAGAP